MLPNLTSAKMSPVLSDDTLETHADTRLPNLRSIGFTAVTPDEEGFECLFAPHRVPNLRHVCTGLRLSKHLLRCVRACVRACPICAMQLDS